jgi:hypothetical protein
LKTFVSLTAAFIITLGAMIYQRATGPTYPQKAEVITGISIIKIELPRSHGGTSDCPLEFTVPDTSVTCIVSYRKYPSSENWTSGELNRKGDKLLFYLPNQPPAGKLEYITEFRKNGKSFQPDISNATVIRFKGDVPAAILIPHIILMFIAMFFANAAGIMAVFKHEKFRLLTTITLIVIGLGGMFFGPWVQYHAFGEAWTGIPFAWDLTDNKTLLAFLFWILAVVMNIRKPRPGYVILASLVMLAVYSIPHSMYGSQLDPATGKIIQGCFPLVFRIF